MLGNKSLKGGNEKEKGLALIWKQTQSSICQ